jgi:hypothetical protein
MTYFMGLYAKQVRSSWGDQMGGMKMLLHPADASPTAIAPVPLMRVSRVPAFVPMTVRLPQRHDFIHWRPRFEVRSSR